jgi:hypothetical protein
MGSGSADTVVSLLPFLLLSLPFAFGNYFLAKRMGKSQVAWVIFSLIPLFNYFFGIYVAYLVVMRILDMLGAISAKVGAVVENQ